MAGQQNLPSETPPREINRKKNRRSKKANENEIRSLVNIMDKLKKKGTVKAKAPDAYLYEPPKSEKKITDKDLFVLKSKDIKNNKK